MGQKVRPTGFRVGVMETWRSRWYASKREFGDLLLEDQKIRKFVATKYAFAEIARVEIEPHEGPSSGAHAHCSTRCDYWA